MTRDIISPLLAEPENKRKIEDVTQLIAAGEISFSTQLRHFTGEILKGNIAILTDGNDRATIIDIKAPGRGVEEPCRSVSSGDHGRGLPKYLWLIRGLCVGASPTQN